MVTNIGELRATLTVDGVQYEMALKKAGEQTDKLDTQTANLATQIFVAQQAFNYGKEALTVYTDAMISAYSEVKNFNAMTGMSIEQGGKWQDMMEDLGLSLSDVTMAFRILSNNVQQAIADPKSGAAQAFKELGVSLVDAGGNMRDSNTVLLETIDALQQIPAGTQRNALAMDTLGRSYMTLNKLLDSATTSTELFNKAISSETPEGMAKLDAFNEAMNKFNNAVGDTKSQIGEGLLPAFTAFISFLNSTALPAINFIGERLEFMGYMLATMGYNIKGLLTGGDVGEDPTWAKFQEAKNLPAIQTESWTGKKSNLDKLFDKTGSVTTKGAISAAGEKEKTNVLRKGLDDEIQINLQSISDYLTSIETKKSLNEDYAEDKEELDRLTAETELMISKTKNKALATQWDNLVKTIRSNPALGIIEIKKIVEGGGDTGDLGYPAEISNLNLDNYAEWSEFQTYMYLAKYQGMSYQEALNAWQAGDALNFKLEKGSILPRLATGGPVLAGSSYLVGEKGPEVFVPNTSGSIIPNGASVNIYVELDGEVIARKIGAPLVGEIRLRTGVRF